MGPLLDRIDISCAQPRVRYEKLSGTWQGEPSRAIRERVIAARTRQGERCAELLEHELGVAPLPATLALAAAVRDGSYVPPTLEPEAATLRPAAHAQHAVASEHALPETRTPVPLAAICVRLDGLPLALELAAARLRLMPAEALLRRLDNRLSLLSEGPRDLPERQRALRAVIAWSDGLLDSAARTLFAATAVFAGSWSSDAAEALAVASGHPTLASAAGALDALAALVDASLVQQVLGATGAPRLQLLELSPAVSVASRTTTPICSPHWSAPTAAPPPRSPQRRDGSYGPRSACVRPGGGAGPRRQRACRLRRRLAGGPRAAAGRAARAERGCAAAGRGSRVEVRSTIGTAPAQGAIEHPQILRHDAPGAPRQ